MEGVAATAKRIWYPKRVPDFLTCTYKEHTTVESQGINYEFQFALIHCSKIYVKYVVQVSIE